MCVVRPENASLQPPTSVPPTPCASGRSVQQGNAVQVTLGLTARCSSCTQVFLCQGRCGCACAAQNCPVRSAILMGTGNFPRLRRADV